MCARALEERRRPEFCQATSGQQPFTIWNRVHNMADRAQHFQSSPSSAMAGMLAGGWLVDASASVTVSGPSPQRCTGAVSDPALLSGFDAPTRPE